MGESQPEDQGLVFENTPLQNLKNILSEVEASVQVTLNQSSGAEQAGVAKTKILKTIDGLAKLPEEQISPVAVEQILRDLRDGQDGAAVQRRINVFDNAAVIKLDDIAKKF